MGLIEKNGKKDLCNSEEKELWLRFQESGNFQITPLAEKNDFQNSSGFEKIAITDAQKIQMSSLLANLPLAGATGEIAKAYKVTFPNGLPHTLMKLKQGGFGSAIMKNGKIAGHASFTPLLRHAAVMGAFSALSIVTGQYFLAQINKEFKQVNLKLDKIIEILYEQKRSEMLSAISFVKGVADNYSFIMEHEQQRIATLCNIQNVKMTALGNVEFYLSDLKSTIEECKDERRPENICERIEQRISKMQENIELSLELYFMCCVLEVYLSQNFDWEYIKNVETEIDESIKMCNNRLLKYYGELEAYIRKGKVNGKNQERVQKYLSEYENLPVKMNEKYKNLRERIANLLLKEKMNQEYYITDDGTIFRAYEDKKL